MSRERCQRARRLISLALDAEIDAVHERDLLRHLRSCPDCFAIAREYEQMTEMLRGSERELPHKTIDVPRPFPSGVRLRALIAAAAAIAVVALAGLSGSAGHAGSIRPTAVFLGASFPTAYDPSRPVLFVHRA